MADAIGYENDTPNLFELIEAGTSDASDMWWRQESPASDDQSSSLSLCSDEESRTISPCSDDQTDFITPCSHDQGAGTARTIIKWFSDCSDDQTDGAPETRITSLSVCADEGTGNIIQPTERAMSGFSVCADDTSDVNESDVRLKTDIEQVGSTVYGLPLYHFRYRTGEERFEGVMAQDVLEVMPDAVSVGSNGFYRVNYAKLGIAMTRV